MKHRTNANFFRPGPVGTGASRAGESSGAGEASFHPRAGHGVFCVKHRIIAFFSARARRYRGFRAGESFCCPRAGHGVVDLYEKHEE